MIGCDVGISTVVILNILIHLSIFGTIKNKSHDSGLNGYLFFHNKIYINYFENFGNLL